MDDSKYDGGCEGHVLIEGSCVERSSTLQGVVADAHELVPRPMEIHE